MLHPINCDGTFVFGCHLGFDTVGAVGEERWVKVSRHWDGVCIIKSSKGEFETIGEGANIFGTE